MYVSDGATVTLTRSLLERNAPSSTDRSAIFIRETDYNRRNYNGEDVVLRLEEQTFNNDFGVHDIRAGPYARARIYSDLKMPIFNTSNEAVPFWTSPLDEAATDRPGIDSSHPWILCASEVCLRLLFQTVEALSNSVALETGPVQTARKYIICKDTCLGA